MQTFQEQSYFTEMVTGWMDTLGPLSPRHQRRDQLGRKLAAKPSIQLTITVTAVTWKNVEWRKYREWRH